MNHARAGEELSQLWAGQGISEKDPRESPRLTGPQSTNSRAPKIPPSGECGRALGELLAPHLPGWQPFATCGY